MPRLDSPLQLSPVFKPKVWGRRDLAPLYPDQWTTHRGNTVSIRYPRREGLEEDSIGEVWLTDDHAVFTNGPVAGSTLKEVCRRYGHELYGENVQDRRFPILAKFLFTNDWLSVQVHPDDGYASRHERGSLGKCEMWYMIRAEPRAEFMLGLKPGVSLQELGDASKESGCQKLLQRFRPEAAEAVFVPPGTVHALGPGLILFEAEQNSDVTYRLDDFGRLGSDGKPRPLHRKKALEVTRPESPALRSLLRLERREPYGTRRFVLACPYFAVEELTLRKIASFTAPPARVEAFAVIAGEGRVETSSGWYAYRTGDVWLVPPATRDYRLVPEIKSRLLKFYVPNLKEDFLKPLLASGAAENAVKKIVFAS